MHSRLAAGSPPAGRVTGDIATDAAHRGWRSPRTGSAMILGLSLAAFGCSSSLLSCSSPLMRCPTSSMSGEENSRAAQRSFPPARSPQPVATASSAARPRGVEVADEHARTTESVDRALVRIALTYLGVPYRWGGFTPAGFDCSGFVSYLHAKVGIAIPHNVAAQYRYGTPIARDELQPGDLVFFDRLRHNGIYIGHGQFIHASTTGDGVKISNLDDSWYKSRWVGGRRLAGGA